MKHLSRHLQCFVLMTVILVHSATAVVLALQAAALAMSGKSDSLLALLLLSVICVPLGLVLIRVRRRQSLQAVLASLDNQAMAKYAAGLGGGGLLVLLFVLTDAWLLGISGSAWPGNVFGWLLFGAALVWIASALLARALLL